MSKQISKSSRNSVEPQRIRDGEGVSIDLVISPSKDVDGRTGVLSGNVNNLPVPSKRYSADICNFLYRNNVVKIFFAQEKFESSELRNMIVVSMPKNAIVHFLRLVDEAKSPSFQEIADNENISPEPLTQIIQEPNETVAMNANFALAAVSGYEGCLDFFHSSAFAIGAIPHVKKLSLDPVVRVNIRTSILMGLINQIRTLVDSHPDFEKYKESSHE